MITFGEVNISEQTVSSKDVHKYAGYSKKLKLFAENMSAKKKINHKADFVNMVLAGGDLMKTYCDGIMGPLYDSRAMYQEAYNRASVEEKSLYGEMLNIANQDITFISERMDTTLKLFSEAATSNMLKPNQQTVLPLQYLETIQNNSRLVVPYKNTEVRTMSRQRIIKEVRVGDKVYILPDAFRDGDLLDEILVRDSQKQTIKLDLSTGTRSFSLLDNFTGTVAGRDKLNPLMLIKKIYIDDGSNPDIVLKLPSDNPDSKASWKSRGKFSTTIENPTDNAIYHISGEVDFSNGQLIMLATQGVNAMDIEVSLSGGTFQKTISAYEVRQDHEFVIDEQISAQYTYNMLDLQDKLTLENIDGLMSATAIIYDTAVHVKDHYCFKELDKYLAMLEGSELLTGLYTFNDLTVGTVDLAPNNTSTKWYVPDPITWRNRMIPEGMSKISNQFKIKLQSREGFTTVYWAHPNLVRLLGELNVVLNEGQEYGGITSDMTVLSGSVKGLNTRVVATMRAPFDYTGADAILKGIPISNAPNEETFIFWQYFTMFDTDGKIRSPENLVLPTVSYLDLFKMNSLHTIMGKLTLTNKDKVGG